MSYYFAQTLQSSFDDAVANTTTALEEGFGIITDDRRESAQAQARRRFPPLQNPWGVQSEAGRRGAEAGGQGWYDVQESGSTPRRAGARKRDRRASSGLTPVRDAASRC